MRNTGAWDKPAAPHLLRWPGWGPEEGGRWRREPGVEASDLSAGSVQAVRLPDRTPSVVVTASDPTKSRSFVSPMGMTSSPLATPHPRRPRRRRHDPRPRRRRRNRSRRPPPRPRAVGIAPTDRRNPLPHPPLLASPILPGGPPNTPRRAARRSHPERLTGSGCSGSLGLAPSSVYPVQLERGVLRPRGGCRARAKVKAKAKKGPSVPRTRKLQELRPARRRGRLRCCSACRGAGCTGS